MAARRLPRRVSSGSKSTAGRAASARLRKKTVAPSAPKAKAKANEKVKAKEKKRETAKPKANGRARRTTAAPRRPAPLVALASSPPPPPGLPPPTVPADPLAGLRADRQRLGDEIARLERRRDGWLRAAAIAAGAGLVLLLAVWVPAPFLLAPLVVVFAAWRVSFEEAKALARARGCARVLETAEASGVAPSGWAGLETAFARHGDLLRAEARAFEATPSTHPLLAALPPDPSRMLRILWMGHLFVVVATIVFGLVRLVVGPTSVAEGAAFGALSLAAALAAGMIGYATREDLVALERGRHAPAAAERLFRALLGPNGTGG